MFLSKLFIYGLNFLIWKWGILWDKFSDSLWEISLLLSVWKSLKMPPLVTDGKMHWKLMKTAVVENAQYNAWALSMRKWQGAEEILTHSDVCWEALSKSMYYWLICCHESIFLSFLQPVYLSGEHLAEACTVVQQLLREVSIGGSPKFQRYFAYRAEISRL